MLWQVDPANARALYEQIADVVRRAIGEGTLGSGDRLPAARELAASLDVNLHTVLKAYQTLRDERLIELRRGRGAVVTATRTGAPGLAAMVDDLVAHAERLGVGRAELIRLIDKGDRHEPTQA